MTDHDPLCPAVPPWIETLCECALIAKVRADEVERLAVCGVCGHVRHMLRPCWTCQVLRGRHG